MYTPWPGETYRFLARNTWRYRVSGDAHRGRANSTPFRNMLCVQASKADPPDRGGPTVGGPYQISGLQLSTAVWPSGVAINVPRKTQATNTDVPVELVWNFMLSACRWAMSGTCM
ncbi:hypothetical protein BPNSA17_34090 [Bordetella petrii]